IPELTKQAGSQAASFGLVRAGVSLKAEARQELRERLEDIIKTSRVIGRNDPGILPKFRIPLAVADQTLLKGARGLVQNAQSLKDQFVKHDMPPDFIEELEAASSSFRSGCWS